MLRLALSLVAAIPTIGCMAHLPNAANLNSLGVRP